MSDKVQRIVRARGQRGDKAAAVSRLDRWLLTRVMRVVGNPRIAVRLWDGRERRFGDGPPVATMVIEDRGMLIDLMRRRQVGFGEGYRAGRIRVRGDLLALLREITRTSTRRVNYAWKKFEVRLVGLRSNTLARSRDAVSHHYDLGNDFYRLWLDRRMLYTCAYYESADATLEDAQLAKMEHVCRKLRLEPGQRVVEAGCGWGAFALHMAKRHGVTVRAYNVSSEQVAWARERAAEQGLTDQVEFLKEDYRNIRGEYDVFVSVGMLEHVGLRNYRQLGDVINGCLKPTGIGLIHSIGRSHPALLDPWIRKRIFPKAHVPSLDEMAAIFEPHRFSILDVENLRRHYARTCADWLDNFRSVEETVREMYGDEFVRSWRLYLAGASAGFSHGTMQLYQVVFAPGGNNAVPWTRAHLYPVARE